MRKCYECKHDADTNGAEDVLYFCHCSIIAHVLPIHGGGVDSAEDIRVTNSPVPYLGVPLPYLGTSMCRKQRM